MIMGCDVFANSDEIACKAGDCKVIAAFPDVCLSPPSPPAGPVPVPYPDTSFSKDMQNGSKTVMIKGKEVMLKDQSFYKTSPLGDEAATKEQSRYNFPVFLRYDNRHLALGSASRRAL